MCRTSGSIDERAHACVCLHPWGRSKQWCSGVMRGTFLWIHTWTLQTPQIPPPSPPPSSAITSAGSLPVRSCLELCPPPGWKHSGAAGFYLSSSAKTATFFGTPADVQKKYLNITGHQAEKNVCNCCNDWHQRRSNTRRDERRSGMFPSVWRFQQQWCGGSITHTVHQSKSTSNLLNLNRSL